MGTKGNATVDSLKVMDDIFFTKLVEDIEFCQEVLRVLMQRPDLKVIQSTPQKTLRNVKGRSVIVDVLCCDTKQNYYNIEVQKEDNDDHQRRVRYNGSNIDTYITEKGTKFSELPEVYVVYISNFDYFGFGKTIYHVDRVLHETGNVIDNGFHEIYVNTVVDDGTDIAGLMNMFKSSQVMEDERFPVVSRSIKHFKEGKGRDIMCHTVEEYAKEVAREAVEKAIKEAKEETAKETILALIKKGMTDEFISDVTKLKIEEIQALRNEK